MPTNFITKTILDAILKLVSFVPAAAERVNTARGKLSSSDRNLLETYVGRIDERKVFFVPYASEVVEACVFSLDQVKGFTDKTRASVRHAAAKAALGVILDSTKGFVQSWTGVRTPFDRGWRELPLEERLNHDLGDGRTIAEFFTSLGELRGVVKLMMLYIQELDPKLVAPNLMDAQAQSPPAQPSRVRGGASLGSTRGSVRDKTRSRAKG
jgi:hypothetical protein